METPRVEAVEVRHRQRSDGPLVLVDARAEEDWNGSDVAIAGALRISPDVEAVGELMAGIPASSAIVVYGSGVHERSSARVAARLQALGFDDVAVLRGGLGAWIDEGYAVVWKPAIASPLPPEASPEPR